MEAKAENAEKRGSSYNYSWEVAPVWAREEQMKIIGDKKEIAL